MAASGHLRHRRAHRAVRRPADGSVEDSALAALPLVRGAYSLVFMDERTLYAARDPQGFRPLVLGRLARGWVVASETAALDIVGAAFVREVEPGELIAIDERGVRSRRFAAPEPRGCLFEYVYLARPDTAIAGRSVQATRVEVGRMLAAEHPVDADLVIPVPESGTPAAIGYAAGQRHPVRPGPGQELLRRPDLHPAQPDDPAARHPAQAEPAAGRHRRQAAGGRGRLDRPRQHPAGHRAMLREAGAAEVHVRISSPPVSWPCFYGIDFASRAELIAGSLAVEEIRDSIGADSLGYVSLDGLTAATTLPAGRLCRACFDGNYPIPVAEADRGKHLLRWLHPPVPS